MVEWCFNIFFLACYFGSVQTLTDLTEMEASATFIRTRQLLSGLIGSSSSEIKQ